MPDLRAYVQETLTCEATAVALGSGEATAPPLPQRIRFFSPCRAGPASSGQAEEETMGKIWCEEDDPTRDGKSNQTGLKSLHHVRHVRVDGNERSSQTVHISYVND